MAWPWQHQPSFVSVGTPLAHWVLGPTTSVAYGALAYYGRTFSQWAMRVQLNGAGATSGSIQLLGTLANSSSEATSALVAATTWTGTANSSNDIVFITGKPMNAVAPYLSVTSSSATSIDVWIAASI